MGICFGQDRLINGARWELSRSASLLEFSLCLFSYINVSFNVLPRVCLCDDFPIEGCGSVRHIGIIIAGSQVCFWYKSSPRKLGGYKNQEFRGDLLSGYISHLPYVILSAFGS